jgi:hypothetical protein
MLLEAPQMPAQISSSDAGTEKLRRCWREAPLLTAAGHASSAELSVRSGQGKQHVTRGMLQDIGTFSVATNLDDIKSAGEAAYTTINNDARKIPGVAEVRPHGRHPALGWPMMPCHVGEVASRWCRGPHGRHPALGWRMMHDTAHDAVWLAHDAVSCGTRPWLGMLPSGCGRAAAHGSHARIQNGYRQNLLHHGCMQLLREETAGGRLGCSQGVAARTAGLLALSGRTRGQGEEVGRRAERHEEQVQDRQMKAGR